MENFDKLLAPFSPQEQMNFAQTFHDYMKKERTILHQDIRKTAPYIMDLLDIKEAQNHLKKEIGMPSANQKIQKKPSVL